MIVSESSPGYGCSALHLAGGLQFIVGVDSVPAFRFDAKADRRAQLGGGTRIEVLRVSAGQPLGRTYPCGRMLDVSRATRRTPTEKMQKVLLPDSPSACCLAC